ncbi:hypothetical protein KR054_005532 [Drosophila jambulina]|nr:hypothetical protein KR054_005532 [Drosophila jambulina]
MRQASETRPQSPGKETIRNTNNKCFYNCQCLCCRQGCCVIVTNCCCCYNITCCSASNFQNTSQDVARRKDSDPLHDRWGVSTLILLVARWTTAFVTLLTSCILLDIRSSNGNNRERSQQVSVTASSVPTTVIEASSAISGNTNTVALRYFYDITNDQQLRSNYLCKMLCHGRKSKRERRKRRRRRRRRRRYRHVAKNKQWQHINNKKQQLIISRSNKSIFQQRPSLCQSFETLKASYVGTTPRNVRDSTLKDLLSMRNCSKINKRNRANLIWLIIGLVWFEVKLINCIGISSTNFYASNLESHKGCTLCHEAGGDTKDSIYNDKDNNPHTDYNNIYNNKYQHNTNHNYFNKKTNNQQKHYNKIPTSDHIRLESIKRQILTKLGLTHKPNVSHPLPKQFIWETIYRADGGKMMINGDHQRQQQHSLTRRNTLTELDPFFDALTYHDPYRPSSEYNWNITKSNVDERLKKNQYGRRYHLEKDDTTKIKFFKNWKELRQLAASYPQFGSKVKSRSSPVIVTKNQRRTLSSIGKSTYLLDLNRSSDSTIKIGVRNNHDHYDHDYFKDYHVQTKIQHNIDDENEKKQKQQFESNHEENDKIDDHEDYYGNTQEIITFAEEGKLGVLTEEKLQPFLFHLISPPIYYNVPGTQYRQYRILEFSPQNRRAVPPNQKLSIRSAQIHIRIDKPHNYWIDKAKTQNFYDEEYVLNAKRKWRNHKIKIWVFELTAGVNITEKASAGIDKAILFRASFEVNTRHLGWQKFDLTETIREWYEGNGGKEKLRLLIDCTGCGGRYSLHLFQTSKIADNSSDNSINLNLNRPFLVLHTESARTRRVRRRAVDCGGALSGQCCKESFYVSFKALGWDDWIIAPRGYFANYCRGDCTGTFRTPDTFQTFHAHFIEEYRKLGLLNGMRPCCAPIKFSSMSLIYYGDDGIIKRDLPKMVVDECGCP